MYDKKTILKVLKFIFFVYTIFVNKKEINMYNNKSNFKSNFAFNNFGQQGDNDNNNIKIDTDKLKQRLQMMNAFSRKLNQNQNKKHKRSIKNRKIDTPKLTDKNKIIDDIEKELLKKIQAMGGAENIFRSEKEELQEKLTRLINRLKTDKDVEFLNDGSFHFKETEMLKTPMQYYKTYNNFYNNILDDDTINSNQHLWIGRNYN